VYPIVVFLLDGLADRAHGVLGGRTGNEAASTPNLDALAAAGSNGLLYAVGPGRAPSSEVAHWSMLGYRPDEFPGRAVFEALGRGQQVSADEVHAYAALRPAERRADGWWLTGRPDPDRDAGDLAVPEQHLPVGELARCKHHAPSGTHPIGRSAARTGMKTAIARTASRRTISTKPAAFLPGKR